MFDILSRAGVSWYLTNKNGWSWANDWACWWHARKAVPHVASPSAAWDYLKNVPYTGDPFGGVGDFYTHPERIVAEMAAGTARNMHLDCDDVAVLAHVMTRQIPGCVSRVVTIVDAGVVGSHVLCVGTFNGQPWAIDTNGYRHLPDLTETTLCRVWNDIYASRGYRYFMAVDTASPW